VNKATGIAGTLRARLVEVLVQNENAVMRTELLRRSS
jgi:hypothetical protein